MKKLLIVPLLCLSLGGCATTDALSTALKIATTNVNNPITKDRLLEIEASAQLLFAGLNVWKRSCAQGLINANCKSQIAAVQVYTRKVPPYLRQLRTFVRANDQVNAFVVYNNLIAIINTVKTQAAASGQVIGG